MSKNKVTKKTEKKPDLSSGKVVGYVILILGMLAVVASITFSSTVILMGTSSTINRYALAPQIAFGVAVLLYAFWMAVTGFFNKK